MEKEPPVTSLKARVEQARKVNSPRSKDGLNESHAYGMAMRLVAELLSGLIVGLIVGWFLDKWLGTKPWLLIIFIFLGLGAGIFNVVRAAKQIEEKQARKREEAAEKAKIDEG
ncbi:ATP synthase protein I [hydrothermal vent metagenome]|uniref:ATP synthase protein I n=1 Tax=hydrothermal vent metagenome TaxID=652676 RepID=A0A3B0SFB7_9ZZZZ